jgi:hypothetical protein
MPLIVTFRAYSKLREPRTASWTMIVTGRFRHSAMNHQVTVRYSPDRGQLEPVIGRLTA